MKYKKWIRNIGLSSLCLVGLGLFSQAWSSPVLIECELDGNVVLPNQVLPMHRSWFIDLYELGQYGMIFAFDELSLIPEDQLSEPAVSFLTRHALVLKQDNSYPNISVHLYRSGNKIQSMFDVFLPKLFKKNKIIDFFKNKTKWTTSNDKHSALIDLALSCSPTEPLEK